MNTLPTRRTRNGARRSDSGVAVLAVLYGLSIFSVLTLTLLKDAALETTLRTGNDPDLHVVLYAGGAGSSRVVGRLNLPTVLREQASQKDASVEVKVPGPVGLDLTSELAPGWAYAVRLSSSARVCCDGGDDACSRVIWDQEIAEASVTPVLERPIQTTNTSHRLQFALSSSAVPDNLTLDPNAAVVPAFLLRATRMPEGSTAAVGPQANNAPMTCKLESGGATVATGTLHISPGADEGRAVTRISSGTVELSYRAPAKPR